MVTYCSVLVTTEQAKEVVELIELTASAQVLDIMLHSHRSLHQDLAEDGRLQC